jgi:pimeloyl-ACP methyl ester carboxylesterase
MRIKMALEHKFTLVDDVNIHYVESGPQIEHKEPMTTLVFLHGFPEYWGTWKEQIDYFSVNYRVIAPDLPGYNLSDKPSDLNFYAVPNLVSVIAKFIEEVSPHRQVYLIAHDWGGAIAWPLTAFHSLLIKKLIILNAAHPSTFTREMINNPAQRQKSAYIHELICSSAESLLSDNNFHYLSESIMVGSQASVFTDEIKAAYRQVWGQEGAINGMLQYYRAMPQLAAKDNKKISNNASKTTTLTDKGPIKSTEEIKIPNIRISVPTLILWGEQDQAFVNENLDDIERYVPNCSIKRFAHTSHWIQHEKPFEVNSAIAAFIP